jgi:hypothetical protein
MDLVYIGMLRPVLPHGRYGPHSGALLVCLMLVLVFGIDRGLLLWCGGLVLV